MGITKFPAGTLHDSNRLEEKLSAYTVVAVTDSGKTFTTPNAVTFTLPGIAIGEVYTFVYTGIASANAVTIDPQTLDGITYAGSSTDNVTLVLTAATAETGDYVTIAALDGIVTWQVTDIRGVWTKV